MSTPAQHTPGPWHVSDDKLLGVEIYSESPSAVVAQYRAESGNANAWGNARVARCLQVGNGSGPDFGPRDLMGDDEVAANARLIAAAPELLAAIETVARDYGITLEPVPNELTGSDLHSTAIRLLRAAYAKAKGGAA